jgi:anti-sigma factor RsiW
MTRDAELMQHADGELTGDAQERVEDLLAHDDEARGKHEAIAELGELVRGHLELAADVVPPARFDAMWRSVDAAIAPAPVTRSGWLRRLSRWLELRRGYLLTAVASAGAVAALALVLRAPTGESGAGAAAGAVGAAFRPTEIESLDTPGGTGTVFHLRDEDGATTVIWVTQDDSVEP